MLVIFDSFVKFERKVLLCLTHRGRLYLSYCVVAGLYSAPSAVYRKELRNEMDSPEADLSFRVCEKQARHARVSNRLQLANEADVFGVKSHLFACSSHTWKACR